MGWNVSIAIRIARAGRLMLAAVGLAAIASVAHAQTYVQISNPYLVLGVGNGATTDGSIFLGTAAANPTNPTAGNPVAILFGGAVEAANTATVGTGTVVYVRVDGGKSAGGNDYIFGRQGEGIWLDPPTVVGNHITARWQTLSAVVSAATIDPQIEVDLLASFVHDQARFQFTIKNNSPGQTHRVGLAFLQDIVVGKVDAQLGGPIRLPTGPYLRQETLLQGGQVPPYFDVFALGSITGGANIPGGPSVEGILAPTNPSQANAAQIEPTRPTRFGYGSLTKLSGVGNPVVNLTFVGRDFDFIWNFKPDPTLNLNNGVIDNAVIDYWDSQLVQSGQSINDITYIGQATSSYVFSPPLLTLGVSAPLALGITSTKDANGSPIAGAVTPSTFAINAFVQNQTDLSQSGGFAISPITMFLDLPKGLVLAPGEINPKTLLNVTPGQESAATWQVMPDPANPVNGKLSYTVSQSSLVGSSVLRTIEVPAPAVFHLLGTAATHGLFNMVSFPLVFGSTPPSTVLGLNANQPAPDFDLVRWNANLGHYEPVNTLLPGLAYWLRSRLPADKTIVVDTVKYPPLDNQVQPTAAPYKINYDKGWNQIATPDIYRVRFSEVQVFDQSTLTIADTSTAADQLHQWLQPAVYFYDTSDPDPQNWHYVLEENFGFDMVPYQGYWLLAKKDGLQFVYPGVDTPGASVTRAALIGVGLALPRSRASSNDWFVKIKAKGTISTDYTTTIGVNTKAIDAQDYYKISKPPTQENQLSLDIIHDDWTGAAGTRYAKDLRSSTPAQKTWKMALSSTKPNEAVTFSWPDLAVSVPRTYRLTLVDTDSNTRYDMRSVSSVVLKTNANKTRNLQVMAEPTRRTGPAVITSFDVSPVQGRASGSSGSVSISYTLSQQADTHVVIRSTGGRIIRTLIGQPIAGSSSNSGRAVFDLRDSQGRAIATGLYQAELTAQGTDGQVSRQIRPFLLPR